ncbi:polyketide cyclase/dehydrase/lipid transport protein [Chitinophaga skermanii]|uniref:Polyketide cyclase/dehydrase/lipid transport protein n=1 Tax=Chitinophaga skermanii TaxID=331697 RepID=A0A327Q3Z4_9BACT|nr:SRPBCC family protein [Chitinophaga skermanii]RAI98723.1 polyketide cyclase/dehydrase/lipid transport protein [Chitinophaga skermanii]
MKFLKALAWIIGILILVFIVLVFVAPKHQHIERSTTINAPDSVVWHYIVDLRKFNGWSEWSKMDTAAVYAYDGEPGTVGHASNWHGDKMGEGKLLITNLVPYASVQEKLMFIKPFQSECNVVFTLTKQNNSTLVKWDFDADYDRPMNVMALLMGGSLGKQFEKGLASLKQQAETGE